MGQLPTTQLEWSRRTAFGKLRQLSEKLKFFLFFPAKHNLSNVEGDAKLGKIISLLRTWRTLRLCARRFSSSFCFSRQACSEPFGGVLS
jgi:hypothetical protein